MEANQINEETQQLISQLTALQKWANDSMLYVKRRNHLNAKDKKSIYQRFEQYEYHFQKLIKLYREGVLEINPDAVSGEIERHLIMQARFNLYAQNKDILKCQPVNSLTDLTPLDLIVILYRHNYITARRFKIGWFGGVKDNTLTLEYDSPRLLINYPRWLISMFNVVRLYTVESIQRDVEQ